MLTPFAGAVVLGRDGCAAVAWTATDTVADARADNTPARGTAGTLDDVRSALRESPPGSRWVVWSARAVGDLVEEIDRSWDLAEVHRLLHGGWAAEPERVWALSAGLDLAQAPTAPGEDLFDLLTDDEDPDAAITPQGYLRPGALEGRWPSTPQRCLALAQAALVVAGRQREAIARVGPRAAMTATAVSAAASLCLDLEQVGLPIERERARELISRAAGPEPTSPQEELAARAARDAPVLASVPGAPAYDLRNPAAVRRLLAIAGVDLPSTRKWVLEAHTEDHPVVPALLEWRARERIATTYGWRWLREHVGPDDRLRGRWAACDGGAGRMTAQAGLHSLPAELRPAVAAPEGQLLVRADLGQVEPRVLAVVSGDTAFASATSEADLYAPVASRLGVERATAKIAVLAAMYGQRSGAAGEALRGLERAYPVAMAHLDAAQEAGRRGEAVRTWGGRLVPTGGAGPEVSEEQREMRGRFARNAVIQGSAAELFIMWAVTVRAGLARLGGPTPGQVVLCLHDELLLLVPQERAEAAATLVHDALADASRRWQGGSTVRFVADVAIVRRWSEAKG